MANGNKLHLLSCHGYPVLSYSIILRKLSPTDGMLGKCIASCEVYF